MSNFEKPKTSEGYVDGNRVIRFDESAMERREYLLKNLFKNLRLPIRMIGDENSPAFILKDSLVLSMFVKNFELIFTDVPRRGEHILKVKLTRNNINTKHIWTNIYQALIISTHRPAYRIKVKDNNMFLAGYNFLNKKLSYGRYPVFSQINPKIYFSEDVALEQIDNIKESDIGDYNLSLYNETIRIEDYFDNLLDKTVEESVNK